MRELATKISKDVFIQTRVSAALLGKDVVRQKIRRAYIPNYFNKYDVVIHIFNAAGEPADEVSEGTFPSLFATYDKEAYRTDYNSVYFVSSPASDVTQKYLVLIPLTRKSIRAGYIVVELALKKIIPENVYPELLVDNRFQQFYRSQDLSYACGVGSRPDGRPVGISGHPALRSIE